MSVQEITRIAECMQENVDRMEIALSDILAVCAVRGASKAEMVTRIRELARGALK